MFIFDSMPKSPVTGGKQKIAFFLKPSRKIVDKQNIAAMLFLSIKNRRFLDMKLNSLNWNEIVDRILFVFPRKNQKQIAEALDISQDLISGWKKGRSKPSWDIFEKIIEITEVDFDWLLYGKSSDARVLQNIYENQYVVRDDIQDMRMFDSASIAIRHAISSKTLFLPMMKGRGIYSNTETANRLLFLALNKTALPESARKQLRKGLSKIVLSRETSVSLAETKYSDFHIGKKIIDHAVADWREGELFAHEMLPEFQHYMKLTGREDELHFFEEDALIEKDLPDAPKEILAPNVTRPHDPIIGEDSILPQLSQMAIELINELNDIHLQALKGVVTEELFKTILAAATASIADAARKGGVEPKKAIG